MSLSEIRKLADDEFDVLKTVEEGYCPDPRYSIAVVAQSEGQIVGRMLLISPAHIEGTWVAESFRKGTTGVRMMRFMEGEARSIGLTKVLAYAETEDVADYLSRLGYKQRKVTVWEKELCH